MDQSHSTTEKRRCSHLTYEERVIIQLRLCDGWSPNRIAKELGRAPNTIRNEIKRALGSKPQKKGRGRPKKYKAVIGQQKYKEKRKRCGRKSEIRQKRRFLKYFVRHFREDGWSPDACRGKALKSGKFKPSEIVSTRTLYHYIDACMLGIRNIDLVSKLKRRAKGHGNPHNRRVLGTSIEERPASVQERIEFGHWEADLVMGSKSGNDEVLLTLLERKTRQFFIIPVSCKGAVEVTAALMGAMKKFGEHMNKVFKSITTDNGLEFSLLHTLEEATGVSVYFAHPYASHEKGSIERHNGLIRRFIRKGHRIDEYSYEWIKQVEMWCNALPRKILGYSTPEEAFDAELDMIYAL